jgi:hypothetical protein
MVASTEWAAMIGSALTFTGIEYERALSRDVFVWSDALAVLLFVLLFVTMRRRNGFATVHDLCTGTRVVAAARSLSRPEFSGAAAPETASSGPERIGPFAVVAREGEVVRARDEALKRHVWILQRPVGSAPFDTARNSVGRAGRLRWLGGQSGDDAAWDAFEAPEGTPLVRWLDGAQPWKRVRYWLLDLAEELTAALRDGTLPAKSGLDHLWLTRDGHVVLLEFAAPGAVPSKPMPLQNGDDVQRFLDAVAHAAVAPRPPLHAREFLEALHSSRFEAPAVIAGNLRSLLHKPPALTRQRRLLSLLLPVGTAFAIGGLVLGMLSHAYRDFDREWTKQYPARPSIRPVLELSMRESVTPAEREQLSIHLAGHFRDVIENQDFWQKPVTLEGLDLAMRWFALDSVVRHPTVTETELKEADRSLADRLEDAERRSHTLGALHAMLPFMLLDILLLMGAFFPVFVRAPFAPWVMGAVVVRKDGAPAGRLRAMVRSLCVAIPAFVSLCAMGILMSDEQTGAFAVALVTTVIFFVGAIWAALRPERGLPDLLTGTYLVPR